MLSPTVYIYLNILDFLYDVVNPQQAYNVRCVGGGSGIGGVGNDSCNKYEKRLTSFIYHDIFKVE